MNKKLKTAVCILVLMAILVLAAIYLHGHTISVLQPAGEIGTKQRNLIIFGCLLSLIVVVPVFTLFGVFAWKYREGNTKKHKYSPDVGGNRAAETIWWLIPTLLIGIISVVTWRSSYALDPYKPISSTQETLHVQVVALDWKWLFIYPGQHLASVNYVEFPVNTPVDFEITSDTVMNSFWIPQLGGQIYAMPGMSTQLNLMANKLGSYNGASANISGKGFAGMKFVAKAATNSEYNSWLNHAQAAPSQLDSAAYAQLAVPSQNNAVSYYSQVDPTLYDTIVMRYMMPMPAANQTTPSPKTQTDQDTHYLNFSGNKN